MKKSIKLKSNKGFTELDVCVAIIITSIMIALISTIAYNTYTQLLATHRNSVATSYAVDVLEKINKLNYNDSSIANGTYQTTSENSNILGIKINPRYTVVLNVQDHNKTSGNTAKRDLIKIITVAIAYEEAGIEKNIMIKTLKLNH